MNWGSCLKANFQQDPNNSKQVNSQSDQGFPRLNYYAKDSNSKVDSKNSNSSRNVIATAKDSKFESWPQSYVKPHGFWWIWVRSLLSVMYPSVTTTHHTTVSIITTLSHSFWVLMDLGSFFALFTGANAGVKQLLGFDGLYDWCSRCVCFWICDVYYRSRVLCVIILDFGEVGWFWWVYDFDWVYCIL